MDTELTPEEDTPTTLPHTAPATYTNVQNYYDIAGPDYEMWSKNFNMHFGYIRRFWDLFSLEKMLMNMNEEVLKKLAINSHRPCRIADLGCGVGAVARYTAKKFRLASIEAVTISAYQIQKGKELTEKEGLAKQVRLVTENFEKLSFSNHSFEYAYALESACHANGTDKALFIEEMARVLKPGGQFCIADGFLKHSGPYPKLFAWLNKKITKYWALPCFATLGDFTQKLKDCGLQNIEVREISYRIAPFVTEIWRNKSLRMKKERWHNVYGPVLGMVMGLYRKHFGYYIISGEKAT
jgi:ubiquinone/menaquinone biosynthesis C-methylase UbiE